MRGWKGRVRQLTAGVGAVAAALALALWGASPASAGGPTSVLVVSAESEETASLYYSDKAYGELERLLDPVGEGTRERPPEAVSASARMITVSWLVHDVTPWRVDRVFLGEMGQDVWIHTASQFTETPEGLWHRAKDAANVHKFMFDLGVMGETTGSPAAIYPAPWEKLSGRAAADQDGDGATASPEPRAAAATGGGTDWWWAIPGVVAGAGAAMVLRPYVTGWPRLGRRKDDPGPRQELLDL